MRRFQAIAEDGVFYECSAFSASVPYWSLAKIILAAFQVIF